MFSLTTKKQTPLERLLIPIEKELEDLSRDSEEVKKSVHEFVNYLANGLLPSAIDLAKKHNYPDSLLNKVSDGRFAELMREYQKEIYAELQRT